MSRTVEDVKKDADEAMAEADAALDEQMRFNLVRIRADEAGRCDACPPGTKGEKFVLAIRAGTPKNISILFCEYHEGEVLRRLLKAYLRRLEGKETVGFCGPLPKDPSAIPGDPIPSKT